MARQTGIGHFADQFLSVDCAAQHGRRSFQLTGMAGRLGRETKIAEAIDRLVCERCRAEERDRAAGVTALFFCLQGVVVGGLVFVLPLIDLLHDVLKIFAERVERMRLGDDRPVLLVNRVLQVLLVRADIHDPQHEPAEDGRRRNHARYRPDDSNDRDGAILNFVSEQLGHRHARVTG